MSRGEKSMQMDQIGAGIAQRRKQMVLSQEELAKLLGVTRQAVSKWESGAALPSVDNIVELARIFSVSVDELLQLEKKSGEPGLSAQSVGLLLDEHSARQENRIKRMMWALIAAAVVLAIGIVVSSLLGMQRTNRMEDNLKRRISDTNAQIQSQINGIQTDISNAVKQALDEGSTMLADSGFHDFVYIHESGTVEMMAFAYPKALGEYSDAEFYAILSDGTRISAPAKEISGSFEGTLSIPATDVQYMDVDAYISWNENGQTVTEKIFCPQLWMDDLRLVLDDVGMHYVYWDQDQSSVILMPYAGVRTTNTYAESYPEKVVFEIYVSSQLRETVEVICEYEDGTVYSTISPEEDILIDGIFPLEELSMRVTVTDRRGNEFERQWVFTEE